MRNGPKALIDRRQTDNWKQKARVGRHDWLPSPFSRCTWVQQTLGGEEDVIQSPPTRWHVLFSVLVSADSINRRGSGNGDCSPPCSRPFLSFSLPSARISRTVCPSVPFWLLSLLLHVRARVSFWRRENARICPAFARTRIATSFNCTPN